MWQQNKDWERFAGCFRRNSVIPLKGQDSCEHARNPIPFHSFDNCVMSCVLIKKRQLRASSSMADIIVTIMDTLNSAKCLRYKSDIDVDYER